MQIWRTQPDAIQRRIRIALGLAEMREALRIGPFEAPFFLIAGIEGALVDREYPGVGIQTPAVGANFRKGHNRSHPLVRQRRTVAKRRVFGAVAVRTVLMVDRRPLRRERSVDRISICWR